MDRATLKTANAGQLEIFKHIFHSVAEEMGAALRRSAFSPNIKERRDYSCAVYDADGGVLAMGDHMPVHLGSMPASVAAVRAALTLEPGDLALLNDPFAGGTHLPDLTMVLPIFLPGGSPQRTSSARTKRAHTGKTGIGKNAANLRPSFYVANRAHHADVGGALAGSMGPASEIFQEGVRIPPVKIFRRGELNAGVMSLILANVRTPIEREGDLAAQIAACRTGERRLAEIVAKYGAHEAQTYGRHLLDYSAAMMRAALRDLPSGTYAAEDFLDDDGVTPSGEPLRIRATITIGNGRAKVDYTGSSPQCVGNVNAVESIAISAVYYVFRCLLSEDVPATSGLMEPITVVAPAGTIVNALSPAAVAGGNVETSQRMVDTILRALAKAAPSRIPAASQGTMNNLTLGGRDPRHNLRQTDAPFAYYETTAGGMGARPTKDGASAIHTHMTNSWNTPVEVFEQVYPVRMRRYAVRRGSGGDGRYRGGDGIIREIELLTDTQVGLLCDRRKRGPYGLSGGSDGAPGKNSIVEPNGRVTPLPGKCSLQASAGSVLKIETPGGGGWGKAKSRKR
jgi:N-methylhydantoinase B